MPFRVLFFKKMFTGITEETAKVLDFSENILSVARPLTFAELKIGQSIAVNGACLSVASYDDEKMSFFLAQETQRKTNLVEQKAVNLERAMTMNGRFEGHCVLGHVEGIATFFERKGENYFFHLPPELLLFCVEKGSIALNGVSLTIAEILEKGVRIAIIPLTAEKTNFSFFKAGDSVNVECDYFAKLLFKWQK